MAALLAPASHPVLLLAQGAPPSPNAVWQPRQAQTLERDSAANPRNKVAVASGKTYSLAELIDVAEQNNPETRVAWEEAKSKADELGIARSSLYPTLTAVALAVTLRQATLIGEFYHRQTAGVFEPILHVEYLVFDLGGRSGQIDVAKANLLAADLAFNDTHRRIIYQVAEAYYRLLNAQGQRQAAESSLENAKTVEEDATARLDHGLATKPDELEATAARAQADFDLQAAIGAIDIARGDLATALGMDPGTAIAAEDIGQLKLPSSIADSVDQEMDRAFSQRPDLLEQLARLRAANAAIKQARSEYFPSLSFKGDGGLGRAYGQQDLLPGSYAEGEVWAAQLELRWNLFDGARREYRLAQANADKKAAQAQIDALRDQIADQVWTAYANMRTAFRQQQTATALLTASQESYDAAQQSYGYGVRNLLDVVSAQKALAQARSEQGTIGDERRIIAGKTSGVDVAKANALAEDAALAHAEAAVEQAKADVANSQAAVERSKAEFEYASNNLQRIEPLLARQFVTVDQVDQARTQETSRLQAANQAKSQLALAEAGLVAAQAQFKQAQALVAQSHQQVEQATHNVTTLRPLEGQLPGKQAAIDTAKYDFDNCHIVAPFDARVTNLTISEGAYANAGQHIFTLIDTRTWWVIANFRETQLRHIRPGTIADVYVMSRPSIRYRGVVDSVGFGVTPDSDLVGRLDAPGLPDVQRTLNWVHLASRFPVRVRIQDPPPDVFRLGESAIVIIRGNEFSDRRE